MKKLEDLSVVELKAIAYDCLVQIEKNQKDLMEANGEIARRAQQGGKAQEEK